MSRKQVERMRSADGARGGKGERAGMEVEKRAVRLVELGPRIRLRMTKVEEGVGGGKVMWHEYVTRSKEEVGELERVWEGRRREKEERKRVQRENVERKRKEKGKKGEGEGEEEEEDEDDEDMDEDEWDSEGLEGDAEMDVNEDAEEEGEFDAQEGEIAAG